MSIRTAFANLRRTRGLRGAPVLVVPGTTIRPASFVQRTITASVAKLVLRVHLTRFLQPAAMLRVIASALLGIQGTQVRAHNASQTNTKIQREATHAPRAPQTLNPPWEASSSLRAWPTPGIIFQGEPPQRARPTQIPSSEAQRPPTASVTWATRGRTGDLAPHAMLVNTKLPRDPSHARIVLRTRTRLAEAQHRPIAPATRATRARTEEPAQPVRKASTNQIQEAPHAVTVLPTATPPVPVTHPRTVCAMWDTRDQTAGRAPSVALEHTKTARGLQTV